ncbi:Protein-glutamate methylesterase/protein-glutamine glutaminase of group 2 operon (plasmid) [Rhodovastum atsumiense]|uniref:chemotaxis protein CheB n=1 Tax=Rhodovastum atsumiense TaxID=504468 RepID=UPI002023C766|nr:chemotaxis protein CheB [Rhodovastum atsumiense]CAH2605459.1 Protein-glutamate methylesterase/protein-glutamine glutaminase of group 2 operon [Rhodovastum atsumiense]
MTRRARVLLAGADARMRLNLRRLLADFPEIEVAGHIRPGTSLDEAAARTTAGVLLVDAAGDGEGVAEALAAVRQSSLRCVVLTGARPCADMPGSSQLPRPGAMEEEPPRSPFARALANALLGAPATIGTPAPASLSVPPSSVPQAAARARQAIPPLRARTLVRPEIIAIGSSTGGPQALPEVLGRLGGRVHQPIVVTQHMPASFTAMLAEHLGRRTGIPTVEACDGMRLEPGRVHLAPGGRHLLLARERDVVVCKLDDGAPENFCRPAVDPMLRAVVRVHGGRALAVILTGMGQDGLLGCRGLVEAGGAVLAQDEATSVVWGMPGAVAMAGLCQAVLPLDKLADSIAAIAQGTP